MGFLSSLFGGLGSALSGAGSSLLGGLGSLGKGAMSLFGGGNSGGMGNILSSFLGGGGQGSSTPNIMMPSSGSSSNPMAQAASSILPTSNGFSNTSSKGKKNGILDSLFPGGAAQGITGMAIPAIGNMFGPKAPKIPDINSLPNVQAFSSFKPGNSVSPEYQKMLQGNTDRLRDQRVRELQATYRSARPGTDYLTDTNYQRDLAEMDRQVQSQMADSLASAEANFSQQEQQRLSELAQMDIYSIMAQTGLDAQEADNFKQMFSNVGNMFLTNATKKPNQLEDLMAMFGR